MPKHNQILGYKKHAEKVQFNGYSDVCDFTPVDHVAIARACGCVGIRIERAADFRPALAAALKSNRVTLLDVVTNQRAYPPVTMFEGSEWLAY